MSLHGLKCSERSVEYVVVSEERTGKAKKGCKGKYWVFLHPWEMNLITLGSVTSNTD